MQYSFGPGISTRHPRTGCIVHFCHQSEERKVCDEDSVAYYSSRAVKIYTILQIQTTCPIGQIGAARNDKKTEAHATSVNYRVSSTVDAIQCHFQINLIQDRSTSASVVSAHASSDQSGRTRERDAITAIFHTPSPSRDQLEFTQQARNSENGEDAATSGRWK